MGSPEKILCRLPSGFEFYRSVDEDDPDDEFTFSDHVLHKFAEGAKSQWARLPCFTESDVFHLAFGSPILRCLEGSSIDGLLCAEGIETYIRGARWIPFDVNSIQFPIPIRDNRTPSRDNIQVSTPFQEGKCQFIINSYDLAPDTLILIPRPLMHLTAAKTTHPPDHLLVATRIPRGLAHLAFPAYQLPEALQNVIKAATSTGVYVNPHNGLRVPFRPKICRLSETGCIPPSTTSSVPAVRGFSILSEAIKMSRKGKEGYLLDLHSYQPCGCDGTIHGPGKAEWDVEIKLRSNIEAGYSVVLHYDVDARGNGDPMAPFGTWHFLMLYDEDEQFCYWIPRDKMRLEWSPALLGCKGSGVIRIPKQDVAEFRIDCRHSDWFSSVVDRIILPNKDVPFDSHPSLKQLTEARSNRNLRFLTPDKTEPDGEEEAKQDVEEEEPHGHEAVEGDDRIRRLDRIEPFWLFWMFQAKCALSKEGLFIVLDADGPAGNYAYVSWSWTDEEVQKFFDKGLSPTFIGHDTLSPHLPAVPIHLHQAATADIREDGSIPHDSVDVGKWRKRKHIFIGDTYLDTMRWDRSRGLYLIPSGECCDKPRATFHRHSSEKLSATLIDCLPKDKFAPRYIVSSDHLVGMFQNFMTEARRSLTQPVRFGRAQVIPGDYITTVGNLMR